MTLKIWSKQLLYIKPDPTPYLLASRTPTIVRLSAAAGVPFLYTNTSNPAILISDTLSNKDIGYGAFDISFTFAPDKAADYKVLFEIPGLCKFAYNWNAGQGLLVYLENLGWRAISTAYFQQEKIEIQLYRMGGVNDVILKVDTYAFTLAKAWESWTQPILTNSDNIEAQGMAGSASYWYRWLNHSYEQFVTGNAYDNNYFQSYAPYDKYYQWNIGQELRITGFIFSPKMYDTLPSTPFDERYEDVGFYTTKDKTAPLGSTFTYNDSRWTSATADNGQVFYKMEQHFNPVMANSIALTATLTRSGSIFYMGALKIFADLYVAPSYITKQLVLYDTKSFNSLKALNTYGD